MAMEGVGHSHWSEDTPDELLYEISAKLELPDLIRFRAVCNPWRTSASPNSTKSLWALVPMVHGNPNAIQMFYSVTERKYYDIPLRSREHCVGSGYGWLVMAEDDQYDDAKIGDLSNAKKDDEDASVAKIAAAPAAERDQNDAAAAAAETLPTAAAAAAAAAAKTTSAAAKTTSPTSTAAKTAKKTSAATKKTAKTAAVMNLSLFHPVAGRRVRLPAFPFTRGQNIFSRSSIKGVKAVVCRRVGTEDFTIFILNRSITVTADDFFEQIVYTSAQIPTWRKIRHDSWIVDLECHCGRVYLLSNQRDIFTWDFSTSTIRKLVTSPAPPLDDPMSDWNIGIFTSGVAAGSCLVSSPCGTLLYVEGASRVDPLRLFKVDFEDGKLVSVYSLNGYSLFLGYHTSVCVSTFGSPHLKKNSVYMMGSFFASLGALGDCSMNFDDGTREFLDPELSTSVQGYYPICSVPSLTL